MNWKNLLWIIPLTFVLGILVCTAITMEDNENLRDIAFTCYCELYPINSTYCELQTQFKDDLIKTGVIDGIR